MACATALCPTVLELQPLRQAVRSAMAACACAAQMTVFAAVLWLLVAGPGLLADHASTVQPVSHTAR